MYIQMKYIRICIQKCLQQMFWLYTCEQMCINVKIWKKFNIGLDWNLKILQRNSLIPKFEQHNVQRVGKRVNLDLISMQKCT